MAICPTCGLPLQRGTDGLLKCEVCGFKFKPNQNTPLLSAYTPKTSPIEIPDADRELQIFIERVVDKLVPIHNDYNPTIKKSLIQTRQKVRQQLSAVFDGKETLDKWFTRTRRDLGVHQIDLTQILFDCLEGLRSGEAREMRAQYEQALQTIKASYHPTTM
jgi:uncharacterized Zn finger protein (UPF0148 family)